MVTRAFRTQTAASGLHAGRARMSLIWKSTACESARGVPIRSRRRRHRFAAGATRTTSRRCMKHRAAWVGGRHTSRYRVTACVPRPRRPTPESRAGHPFPPGAGTVPHSDASTMRHMLDRNLLAVAERLTGKRWHRAARRVFRRRSSLSVSLPDRFNALTGRRVRCLFWMPHGPAFGGREKPLDPQFCRRRSDTMTLSTPGTSAARNICRKTPQIAGAGR